METTFNPEIEENGNVNISDDVVSTIASLAASEVKGIVGMSNSISGGFAELLGKKNLAKGVKITINENDVILDLAVIVEYGVKIPDVAWELQEKVKTEVESMTGLNVSAVNVTVDGVNVPKQETEEPVSTTEVVPEEIVAEEE